MKEIPSAVGQNEDARFRCLAVGGRLNSKKLREVSLFLMETARLTSSSCQTLFGDCLHFSEV